MWREHFEAMANGTFLPPVSVDTDPAGICNMNCIWCNGQGVIKDKDTSYLSKDHLMFLADLYKKWGVKSTCIAGGGEPLLNPHLPGFLYRLKEHGIEAGIITNGSKLTHGLCDTIADTCRWIGISVDAGTPETYVKVKGINDPGIFHEVIHYIRYLARVVADQGGTCEVAYKYLLHPQNANEVYKAAELSKKIKVDYFHLRPVCVDNIVDSVDKSPLSFDGMHKYIDQQIEASLGLETDRFRFFGIRHKFQPDFKRKVNFKRCRATPLIATFGADGNCHICFDLRGKKELILCRHEDIIKVWGSDKHKEMIDNIDPQKCPRCTFGPYNEMVEQVFMKDSMCRYFP
jgi:MoaA/NifB/PqqE/SkfB family radical SAM enzyme